jgi:hypothetical protein
MIAETPLGDLFVYRTPLLSRERPANAALSFIHGVIPGLLLCLAGPRRVVSIIVRISGVPLLL